IECALGEEDYVRILKVSPEDEVLTHETEILIEGTGFFLDNPSDYKLRLSGHGRDLSAVTIEGLDAKRFALKFVYNHRLDDILTSRDSESILDLEGVRVPFFYQPSFLGSSLYVDSSVPISGSGNSWETAFKTLYEAIDEALGTSVIRVAEGVYYPKTSEGGVNIFHIKDPLHIYGGFPRGGGDQADPSVYPTILSGDLGTKGNPTDNATAVVLIEGEGKSVGTVELNGLIIQDGFNSIGRGGGRNVTIGAGVFIDMRKWDEEKPKISSITIERCNIRNNVVAGDYSAGAGIGILAQIPSVEIKVMYSQITDNEAGYGSAIGSFQGKAGSKLQIVFSVLARNVARRKGALLVLGSDVEMINSIIYKNTATHEAAAIHIVSIKDEKPPRVDIRNSIIYDNKAYLEDTKEISLDVPRPPGNPYESQISARGFLFPWPGIADERSIYPEGGPDKNNPELRVDIRNSVLSEMASQRSQFISLTRTFDAPCLFLSTDPESEDFMKPISSSIFLDKGRAFYLNRDFGRDWAGTNLLEGIGELDLGVYEYLGSKDAFITKFSPTEAIHGDLIQIQGKGFDVDDISANQVYFLSQDNPLGGGVSNGFIQTVKEDEIGVLVPRFAVTGRFRVVVKGQTLLPLEKLRILPPGIYSIEPRNAFPGDVIVLRGRGFRRDPDANIIFFKPNLRAEILESSVSHMKVRVPLDRRIRHGRLSFQTENGNFESDQAFTPILPYVRSLSPLFVNVSQDIVLEGLGFSPNLGDNQLLFEGLPSYFVQPSEGSENSLTFQVPFGAKSGYIRLTIRGISVVTPDPITVSGGAGEFNPRIESIHPIRTYRGDRILVRGEFSSISNTIFFKAPDFPNEVIEVLAQTVGRVSQIVVEVPDGAVTSNLVLIASGKERVFSNSVLSILVPKIIRVVPESATVSQEITVIGENFDRQSSRNEVLINGDQVAVVPSPSGDYIRFSVPSGVPSGNLSVRVNKSVSAEDIYFRVEDPLVVDQVSPLVGEIFSLVSITGRGFTPDLSRNFVDFQDGEGGEVTAKVLNAHDEGILFRVPLGARTGRLRIRSGGQIVRTQQHFTVISLQEKTRIYGSSLRPATQKLIVYPNPNPSHILNFAAPFVVQKLRIFDMLMKEIILQEQDPEKTEGHLIIRSLTPGIYWLEIIGPEGKYERIKWIRL
ncbi:MAG: IPT/TIG domain-containing protein, partial [Cytophagales bacterium]|nr:IPT/TIG domain-containing protein [Cytophagales bacterium]